MAVLSCRVCGFQFEVKGSSGSRRISGNLGALMVTCDVIRQRLSAGPVDLGGPDCAHIDAKIMEAIQRGEI
jgi:hypothetical protein